MCAALSCRVDLVAADPDVFGLISKSGWNEYGTEPGYQWLKSLSIQALGQLPSNYHNGVLTVYVRLMYWVVLL